MAYRNLRYWIVLPLFGLQGYPSAQLIERKVNRIEGVYYTAIHMDCSKAKVAICDYEEGIKYNEDGTFEWMISKNKIMESRQVGKFQVLNDTVFHADVVQINFALKPCDEAEKCKDIEKRKAQGESVDGSTTSKIADFSSVVWLKGDGTYRMKINGTKDVVYWKIR